MMCYSMLNFTVIGKYRGPYVVKSRKFAQFCNYRRAPVSTILADRDHVWHARVFS